MTVTVYEFGNSARVVCGEHKPADAPHTVRVYPDTRTAFAAESNPYIRAAILRIDPEAGAGCAPLTADSYEAYQRARAARDTLAELHPDNRARATGCKQTFEQREANAGVDFYEEYRP